MAPTELPTRRRFVKSMMFDYLIRRRGREVQLSGDAVPEREHTASTSMISEMAPVLIPSYTSSESLEEPNERSQNQEEDVWLLQPHLELSGGRRDDSGPITTIREEGQPSGDAVPEIEETPTSMRGIPFNEKCQEMINMISKKNPWPPSVTASERTCCIFKVPHMFVGNSYNPSVVSIGPYHRGKLLLKKIEDRKWVYLDYLLRRKPTKTFEDYLASIVPLEKDARQYYSEIIDLKSHEFIEMMVLDGCFIIELFRWNLVKPNDLMATVGLELPFIYKDFLLLENQIPFFILEKLFEISKMPSEEESSLSLSLLAMQFFNKAPALRRPHDFICQFHDLKGWHLLDLVRLSFVPEEEKTQSSVTPTHIMHSISKLRSSGIKVNPAQAKSFLVVKFENGVIEMPRITLDRLMGPFLSNCVAFEQYRDDVSTHFTTYATFLKCLVETAQDVGYLRHRNIMEHNLDNDDEVACFINKMGKDVMVRRDCYLSPMFENVNEYHRSSWNRQWATFKHKYFDTPWLFISALAAFALLSFTIVQTFYTIYAYYKHHS